MAGFIDVVYACDRAVVDVNMGCVRDMHDRSSKMIPDRLQIRFRLRDALSFGGPISADFRPKLSDPFVLVLAFDRFRLSIASCFSSIDTYQIWLRL